MTIREALQHGSRALLRGKVRSLHPRLDAETLLLHALQRPGDRAYLLSHADDLVSAGALALFQDFVTERSDGKPVQYITGNQEFWGLEFEVTPHVLIPRPETELIVAAALELLPQHPRICDVGTGSGCIAIALAYACPDAEVCGLDISLDALAVAKRNAERLAPQVTFAQADLLQALSAESLNVITSNPPYIGTAHRHEVEAQVQEFEPSLALWAGSDGLEFYRRLIPEAHACLVTGGHLILEIGFGMLNSVLRFIEAERWKLVKIAPDLQGIPRVLICQKVD